MEKHFKINGGFVAEVVPAKFVDISHLPYYEEYTKFWKVTLLESTWIVAKGHPKAPREYVVWFPTGQFWALYGNTMVEALEGAC